MDYIAHIDPETGRTQSVLEHLMNTAQKASEYAAVFGASEEGYLCGMLHDIGKYSDKFQRRISGSPEKVDHSTAGALEAVKAGNFVAAFCIAGHHGGIPDSGVRKGATPDLPTFWGKISRVPGRDIADYSVFSSELCVPTAEISSEYTKDAQSLSFFTHMLFSCLVDSDFLDTEHFMSGGNIDRTLGQPLEVLLEKLEEKTKKWQKPVGKLNTNRCEILGSAIEKGRFEKGLFTLTVPTGGGKTVSSMAFALNHALTHGLRRVIYVIPYTSIIEQTQKTFEDVFGEENVVAHYANVEYRNDEDKEREDKRYLAAENWDAPIILTTAVQFFESLYSNRPSRCRKLHNIADSVIIFDEAQMLPVPYLLPCVSAISQLVGHYGCSAVLCTATQPALDKLFMNMLPEYTAREICPDVKVMYESFRRVRFEREGLLSDESLAGRLSSEKQVLCIVNNRKQAQKVFSMLEEEGSFHLSTTMYPLHRRRVLDEIRERLNINKPCRVISTSLVEAGVDVDFPTVYRALAGLDSMIQAGGRCNRENKRSRDESIVHLFETEQKAPDEIRQNVSATERVMRDFEDISSPEAIRAYFEFLYYTLKNDNALDSKGILKSFEGGSMPFATVAENFRIIEGMEYTVFIPLGEGAELTEQLRKFGSSRKLMRKLGQFSVGVYFWQFKQLIDSCAAEILTENSAVLRDLSIYNEKTGLSLDVKGGQALIN